MMCNSGCFFSVSVVLKMQPLINSISITWEFVRTANSNSSFNSGEWVPAVCVFFKIYVYIFTIGRAGSSLLRRLSLVVESGDTR